MGKRLVVLAAAIVVLGLVMPYIFVEMPPADPAATEPASVSGSEGSSAASIAARSRATSPARGSVAYAQEAQPTGSEGTAQPTAAVPDGEQEKQILEERTPVPTATPGPIQKRVAEMARSAGLSRLVFLGLSIEEWINLAISLGIVLAAYLAATWLLWGPLRRLVRGTKSKFDDHALTAVGPHIRWLIVILCLSFATSRLGFVSVEVKQVLSDTYFLAGSILLIVMGFRLINLGFALYREHVVPPTDLDRLDPLLTLVRRIVIVFLIMASAIVILSHFGVNVTALTASLGLAGLALSLAAQDTLSDAISGFIILIDQPFRVGDRIEIAGEDTWGDVVEIGTRTTRIRTRDNRMVVVPNSMIGKSQVVNYTFPDPEYRVETHLGIGYGTDIEEARRIIVETVRHVPGVLPDRPVDALYDEIGDSAMIFRVRWWIESYMDTRQVYDRVHTALQKALDTAGIDMPFPTQTVNVRLDPANGDGIRGLSHAGTTTR
jgi:MscS family membrane protein